MNTIQTTRGGLRRTAVILFALSLFSAPLPSSPLAHAQEPAKVYYSDLTRDAVPDPAFADSHYKTRRDVLSGVVGPETWVEHLVREGTVIETLTYNQLTYGIIVKKNDGAVEYWALTDDKKSYALSGSESPAGWTIKNPPAYGQIIDKVKALLSAKPTPRYDDAITYITEVMRDSGIETAELYVYRGVAYDSLEEFGYAKADYLRAISIDNTIADAYFNLGIIYRNDGDAAHAIPCFERYLVLYPTDPRAQTIRDYINANK
jgi:tetratricopeptide (TPR) repeat protein